MAPGGHGITKCSIDFGRSRGSCITPVILLSDAPIRTMANLNNSVPYFMFLPVSYWKHCQSPSKLLNRATLENLLNSCLKERRQVCSCQKRKSTNMTYNRYVCSSIFTWPLIFFQM